MKSKASQIPVLLLAVTVTTLLFTQCYTKKYYTDFKNAKKTVNTLVLLSPYVSVEFLKNKEIIKDDELETKLRKEIFSYSSYVFIQKYQLTNLILSYDTINMNDLSTLFSILDNSDKNAKLPIPPFIQNLFQKDSNRYFVMVFYKGFYNAHFQPNFRIQQAMMWNKIFINSNFNSSDMRVLVFDNKNKIIVYYGKKYSKNIDPRVFSSIEQMTYSVLRPLYLK